MPNETDFYSLESDLPLLQNDTHQSSGFYFSDFETGTIFSINTKDSSRNIWPEFTPHYLTVEKESDKKIYLEKIEKITQNINKGDFKKVVYSKIKNKKKPQNFALQKTFDSLCKEYPNTFVYCISTPDFGTWIGATPEVLIEKKENEFKTVSLAGTRVKGVEWTEKERMEQQVVTDFISQNIAGFCSELDVSEPYDLDTGSVIHLKSDIRGKLNKEHSIWEVASALNPTPAVCGLPQNLAKEYILNNEIHQRKLYTGCIGPMNLNKHQSLFVNLRCMQIGKNDLSLYLGGGIMGDSIPENEWIETENKSKTLLSILVEKPN